MTPFPRLFSPGSIGSMSLKNRLVMPPMGTCLADVTGAVSRRLRDYYVERAKGGVGLIVVENTLVDSKRGIQIVNQLRIDEFKFLPLLYDLTEAVHCHGAKIAIQINSAGAGMRPHLSPGIRPVGPSPVKLDFQPLETTELSVQEIEEIVADFGRSARMAKLAGFDAVEVHGAHGYLINQFLSPYCNHRSDAYGGDFERRLRFCRDVLAEVRNEVGPDFPVLFRMCADEFLGGEGLTLDQAARIASELEKAGVDALDLSAGNLNMRGSCVRSIPSLFVPDGHLADHAKTIKASVGIPVIVAGKIRDPDLAEAILSEGKADFIAVGRGLLADPAFPVKSQRGDTASIRRCISCNDMCIYRKTWLNRPIRCSVNPEAGREGEGLERATHPKKIVVVGGGPAGMEAARVAALRGHRVTLYESGPSLGGQLLMACLLPAKEPLKEYVDFLASQLAHLGVRVCLSREVTPDRIGELDFDAIVFATGAQRRVLDPSAALRKNVFFYDDVLLGRKEIPGSDVLVAGGGMIGADVAWYLSEVEGKRVRLLTRQEEVGGDSEPVFTRPGLLARLAQNGVAILAQTEIREILDNAIRVRSRGTEAVLQMDALVLCQGRTPHRQLIEAVSSKVEPERIYVAGDCVSPRRLPDAVHEGYWAGARI